MHHPTDRIAHATAFVTPVVEHWLEREIAQWVRPMKDRSDDPSHYERTLLPRSYISLLQLVQVDWEPGPTEIVPNWAPHLRPALNIYHPSLTKHTSSTAATAATAATTTKIKQMSTPNLLKKQNPHTKKTHTKTNLNHPKKTTTKQHTTLCTQKQTTYKNIQNSNNNNYKNNNDNPRNYSDVRLIVFTIW